MPASMVSIPAAIKEKYLGKLKVAINQSEPKPSMRGVLSKLADELEDKEED